MEIAEADQDTVLSKNHVSGFEEPVEAYSFFIQASRPSRFRVNQFNAAKMQLTSPSHFFSFTYEACVSANTFSHLGASDPNMIATSAISFTQSYVDNLIKQVFWKTTDILSAGRKSGALDFLMKEIDGYLLVRNFEVANSFLRSFAFDAFPTSFPVSILTLTLPWKRNLYERKEFFDNSKRLLSQKYPKHEDVERTLFGLE
jgi:hypothetical protein